MKKLSYFKWELSREKIFANFKVLRLFVKGSLIFYQLTKVLSYIIIYQIIYRIELHSILGLFTQSFEHTANQIAVYLGRPIWHHSNIVWMLIVNVEACKEPSYVYIWSSAKGAFWFKCLGMHAKVNLILKKEAMWDFPYFSCMVTRLTSMAVSDELTLGIRVLACITLLFGLREWNTCKCWMDQLEATATHAELCMLTA